MTYWLAPTPNGWSAMIIRAAAFIAVRSASLDAFTSCVRRLEAHIMAGTDEIVRRASATAHGYFRDVGLCRMDKRAVRITPITNSPNVAREPPSNAMTNPATTAPAGHSNLRPPSTNDTVVKTAKSAARPRKFAVSRLPEGLSTPRRYWDATSTASYIN